eukprot:TRINITY_DN101606_c0_g1_i1.p2 TRINITY_DN101606_c0_g1~~TRINITY_DN101606_c0_g1_i1.p2  ORF type:complete len:297 (+),score=84.07 TRINITY_DN101606_c0_g1_i1:123-1013(+)
MQFTPQQLTGGPKFQHRVRIGNWSEDLELEEIKMKDYLKKKEAGCLMVTQKQQLLEASLVGTQLSPSPDGLLHFGSHLQMLSHQANAFLCANPYDAAQKSFDAWMLTTSSNAHPTVRNVFELERADAYDGFEGDVIHYGQNFRLKLRPFSKIEQPAYMHSELVTALAAAKFSRHQEVTAMAAPTGETTWQILHPDTENRFETEGEPVPAGSPVVIRHVATGSFLASDEIPYNNIFGLEFEVHCFPYFSLGKSQNLVGEMKGEITGDYALRRHGLQNVWTFVTETHGLQQASNPLGA